MPKKRGYWVYLESQMIQEINAWVTGTRGQLRDANRLAGAVNRCREHVAYNNAGIVDQVFVLIEGLVHGHPFVDGVRRFGV